jgi:hypothetical protein
MKIRYKEAISFQKTFKKLLKKYPSLRDDLEVAKVNAIELFHLGKIDSKRPRLKRRGFYIERSMI